MSIILTPSLNDTTIEYIYKHLSGYNYRPLTQEAVIANLKEDPSWVGAFLTERYLDILQNNLPVVVNFMENNEDEVSVQQDGDPNTHSENSKKLPD